MIKYPYKFLHLNNFARVSMAAVSFRPAGPIMSTPRPALISPTAGGVTLVQTGTKTIVTQNPAGIFKPITTQVSATGQNTVKAAPVPVRVPIGQRVSVVSGTPLAVSLTPANPGHIQVVVSGNYEGMSNRQFSSY